MLPLLVCGNVNVETVFRVPESGFPSAGGFFPDALSLGVGGVGANVARAAGTLGSAVRFLTFAAGDDAGRLVRASLDGVLDGAEVHFASTRATPQSLAVVQPGGSHVFYRDLKDVHGEPAPVRAFQNLLPGCSAAILSNIGWTRALLPLARGAGVPVVTDVQDIRHLNNPYDAPYFGHSDVLFLSAAHLSDPAGTLRELLGVSPARILIAGLGEGGALLLERGEELHHQPVFAVESVYRGGAGDALVGAFSHFFFSRGLGVREALRLACAAAALKLHVDGSGQGHPTESEVRAFAGGV